MSASSLRPTAAEFKPIPPLATTTVPVANKAGVSNPLEASKSSTGVQQPQAASETADHQPGSSSEPVAAYYENYEYEENDDTCWGYYDEEGNWVDESWYQQPHTEEDTAHEQQQQQHSMTANADEAVDLLHSCYPTHPRALLQQLLNACDQDVQQAARMLSDIEFEQRRARITPGSGTTSSIPYISKNQQQQKNFNYSLEQFPALGGGGPGSSNKNSASSKQATQGGSWAAVTSSSKPAAATGSKPISRTKAPPPTAAAAGQSRVCTDSEAAAVPWVETGTAVSQEYAAARADASDFARIRNACFQQATTAYLAGNKALAKELSAKGKAAAEAMWAAHERASSQIYQQRNARLQQQVAAAGGGGGGRSGGAAAAAVIDLHGLHVQEMMHTLPQQLAALAAQQHESASVIVGVGRHTKGPPTARMGPAVEALLKDKGYSYKQPQPGLLRVRLR